MKRLIKYILLYPMFILGTQQVIAQDNSVCDSEFLIVLGTVDGEYRMTCLQGCAWRSTSFSRASISAVSPQGISHYGMSKLSDMPFEKDPELKEFFFTIHRQGNDLVLVGGTSWKELRFNCPDRSCTQPINQNGLIWEQL